MYGKLKDMKKLLVDRQCNGVETDLSTETKTSQDSSEIIKSDAEKNSTYEIKTSDKIQNKTCLDSDDNKVDSILRIFDKELPSTVKSYVTEENKNSSKNQFVKNNYYANPKISLNNGLTDCLNGFNTNGFLDNDNSFNENDLKSKMPPNLCDHKACKLFCVSDSKLTVKKNQGCCCIKNIKEISTEKIAEHNNVPKQIPKSCQKETSLDDALADCLNTFDDDEFSCIKKIPKYCQDDLPDIKNDPQIEKFKTTLEIFLQQCICLSLPFNIDRCIECRIYQMKKNLTKNDRDNISCRFYAFRQLKFTETGSLVEAGYPDPYKDVIDTDLDMWLPSEFKLTPSCSDIKASMKILKDAGKQFCKFVQDENEASKLNWPYAFRKREIVWKKYVSGMREMCDVCKTTIFNYHWSCCKCGFVVCIDCFRTKLDTEQLNKMKTKKKKVLKNQVWFFCFNKKEHQVDQLTITQIIAGDALNRISYLMHEVCENYNIPLNCDCKTKQNFDSINQNASSNLDHYDEWFSNNMDDLDNKKSRFRPLLNEVRSNYILSNIQAKEIKSEFETKFVVPIEIKSCNSDKQMKIVEKNLPQMSTNYSQIDQINLMHNLDQSDPLHKWLCDGTLLCLLDHKNNANNKIFQEHWNCGQPVMITDVSGKLNTSLWNPESFARDFGDQTNDLIDCVTGNVISDQKMSKFWNGFENAIKRLQDEKGNRLLLKLKDWPPSEDFSETLPDRFNDLMKYLPMKEYTHRDGMFNLASYLPECFVRPDLGPKMYTAYANSSSKYTKIGTTNLHLDISDAVNVMVYVGVTKNCEKYDENWYKKEALDMIDKAGCDEFTRRRLYVNNEIPGALWHIYHASDAAHIRDLLIKISVEKRIPLEECSDPIHDQSIYLDEHLRERLFIEYGVKGYTIIQFFGDAVFIPAGAPHQVKNLHNCIKVAEDFVSPENVHHSFEMTQQFRNLTDSHTNHEDKLQIKNIVFHAIKYSISVLSHKKSLKPKKEAIKEEIQEAIKEEIQEAIKEEIQEAIKEEIQGDIEDEF